MYSPFSNLDRIVDRSMVFEIHLSSRNFPDGFWWADKADFPQEGKDDEEDYVAFGVQSLQGKVPPLLEALQILPAWRKEGSWWTPVLNEFFLHYSTLVSLLDHISYLQSQQPPTRGTHNLHLVSLSVLIRMGSYYHGRLSSPSSAPCSDVLCVAQAAGAS